MWQWWHYTFIYWSSMYSTHHLSLKIFQFSCCVPWPLKVGSIGLPQTSGRNYHCTLRNISDISLGLKFQWNERGKVKVNWLQHNCLFFFWKKWISAFINMYITSKQLEDINKILHYGLILMCHSVQFYFQQALTNDPQMKPPYFSSHFPPHVPPQSFGSYSGEQISMCK